jgi:predicted nucleotidyltransferase
MREAILVINELKEKGLIKDYAIGGGIATLFYTEPFLTYDLDIFILTETTSTQAIIDLSPIFEYLKKKGYYWKGEHILIEGVPVQFIYADELEKEAVEKARIAEYEGVKTKVIAPEYLIAILLRAGRKKDIEKVEKLLQEAEIDKEELRKILDKFGLRERFKSYERG